MHTKNIRVKPCVTLRRTQSQVFSILIEIEQDNWNYSQFFGGIGQCLKSMIKMEKTWNPIFTIILKHLLELIKLIIFIMKQWQMLDKHK